MAMFTKKATEDERQLATWRADLANAQKRLTTVLSREDAAAKSTDRYTIWSTECDAAEAEVRRFTKLVASQEAVVREAAMAAADAEKRRQVETCRAANKAVDERSKGEVVSAISTIMTYVRDAAAAAVEANRLNGQLPPGVAAIEIGDFLGRELPRLPRQNLATEELMLWVNSFDGGLIGNQNEVADNGDGTGVVHISRSQRIACVKRPYVSTTYYPAVVFDHPGHFFSLLRLPFPDRPGVMFDGARVVLEQVAKMPIDLPPLPKPSSRMVQTELVPVGPWPPAGVGNDADRAA